MSTLNEPVTPKGKATCERLLKAAETVALSTNGCIELSAVAKEAGVTASLINRYFGSKAGLVCALVDDLYGRFDAEVFDQVVDDDGTWLERERRRLESGVSFHYREPFSIVLYSMLAMEPEVAQLEARQTSAKVNRAARSIRKAQKAGELPVGIDPGMAGAAMFGAMRQVMTEALSRPTRPSQKKVVEILWRQVLAAVQIDHQ